MPYTCASSRIIAFSRHAGAAAMAASRSACHSSALGFALGLRWDRLAFDGAQIGQPLRGLPGLVSAPRV
jgi:hypothetical protein